MIRQLKRMFQNLKWNPFAFGISHASVPWSYSGGPVPTTLPGSFCETSNVFGVHKVTDVNFTLVSILLEFFSSFVTKVFKVYKEFCNQWYLGGAGATAVGSFQSFTVVLKSMSSSFLQRVICTQLWLQTGEFIENCRGSEVMKHLWGLGGQQRHGISNSRLVTSKSPGTILKYRFLGLCTRVI